MDWMGRWWDVGGTGVGRMDVSRQRNGSATIGAGTGAPPLALEGRRAVGSGVCRQLLRRREGRGVFVSEQQNNTNILQKICN